MINDRINITEAISFDIINTSISIDLEQGIKILNYYKHRGFANWMHVSYLGIIVPERVTSESLRYNYALRPGECKLISARYKWSQHNSF